MLHPYLNPNHTPNLFQSVLSYHNPSFPSPFLPYVVGGVLNEALLAELREVARELADKMTFVYIDGTKHEGPIHTMTTMANARTNSLSCISISTISSSITP